MTFNPSMKIADFSDSELVAQSLAGNRDAFGGIVTRYQSLLCALAYSATGSLSQSEDLAQETFVTAWKQLADLREPEKLRSWLCRISRNLTYDAVRRQGREPIHKAESLEELQHYPAPDSLPSDYTVSQEEEAILWRSIERIPEIYRDPLVLYYREHQSIQNVATALELTEDTVKQRLSRGRKLLRDQVLAFVEGALQRTNPGKKFTIGVLAAIPALPISAKAATGGVAAAKGSATAKVVATTGLFTVILAPVLGFFGNYIAYRIGIARAKSHDQRARIKSFYLKLIVSVLGFLFAYCLLIIWARQIIADRHMISSVIIFGLVLPFSFIVVANGIYWLRGSRTPEVGLPGKNESVNTARPAWEYCSKLRLVGLPFIHLRVNGGFAASAAPVKAWIAAGDYAVGLLFAFGAVAIGPVSVGGVAVGLLSFGGCALGLFSLGGFSIGAWSFGALAFGWQVYGACAIAWNAASGGVAIAHDFAAGGIAHAMQANNEAARTYVHSSSFLQHAHLALRYLALLNLLWVIPMLVKWRIVAQSRRQQDQRDS
jgi:RNA polymerase sigma factor (sigma-70 family)